MTVRLGYNRCFITRARLSARQGRDREIRVREGLESPNTPRERSRFHISLPFNRASMGLSYRFGQKGIDVSFTNNDSIKNRITSKVYNTTNSGVYFITCKKEDCEEIYVGQSQNITTRLEQHIKARTNPSKMYYTSAKHTRGEHLLEPDNALIPYKSNSLSHRLIIETCFISMCKTIKGNKTSSNNRDMNILGPIILGASPIDWKVVSASQPSFNLNVVPKKYRRFFSMQNQRDNLEVQNSQRRNGSPTRPPEILHRYFTRLRGVNTT